MKISEHGITHIQLSEGFRNKPYLCSAGHATVGFGSRFYPDGREVRLSDSPVTVQEAEKMMIYHLEHRVYPTIKKYITIGLDQSQFDALCSFIYNLGDQALINKDGSATKIRMRINTNPNDTGIIDTFLMWDRKTPSVLARHAREADLYFNHSKTELIREKLQVLLKDQYIVDSQLILKAI